VVMDLVRMLSRAIWSMTRAEEAEMALIYLGKDPNSVQGQSPTLYYYDDERDTYVF
jgi:hypothetical protein